jgi:hypothetical protein
MSTKTTFKRVALVTVAALGFGVLTSIAPASAASTASFTVSSSSITVVAGGTTGDDVTNGAIFKITLRNTGTTATSQALQAGETLSAEVVGWPAGTAATAKSQAVAKADLNLRKMVPGIDKGNAYGEGQTWTPGAAVNTVLTYGEADTTYNDSAKTTPLDNSFYLAVEPDNTNGDDVIDEGTYTVRLRLTNGSLLVQDTLVKVTFVSSAANSGAVLTTSNAGSFAAGSAQTAYAATKYIKATIADANGGKLIAEAAAGTTSIPDLTVDLVNSSGTVVTAATGLTELDTATTADHGYTTTITNFTDVADANAAKYFDGSYGITATTASFPTAQIGSTNKIRVRYGAASATAAIVIVNATDAATGTASVSGTGIPVTDVSPNWSLPLTTKTAVVSAKTATAGNAIVFTVTWANTATGDVSPVSATPTVVYADSTGTASLTLTNNSPISGATATVAISGFTVNPDNQVITWRKSAAASATVDIDGAFVKTGSINVATATFIDAFGAPVAGIYVKPSFGADSPYYSATRTYAALTTDAKGQVSYTWTDAAAVADDVDSITFTEVGTSVAGSADITYAAAAPTPTTLTAFYNANPDTTQSYTAVATAVPTTGIFVDGVSSKFAVKVARNNSKPIDANTGEDALVIRVRAGVEGAKVTATVSSGAYIVGAANLAATTKSSYANSDGDVYFVVGSNTAGVNTVTFTSGTVTATAKFHSSSATTNARFVTLTGPATGTANGDLNSYTVLVTDRYGNPMGSQTVSISASGAAVIGGGATTSSFTTDSSGTFTFTGTALTSAGGAGTYKVAIPTTNEFGSVAGYSSTTPIDSTVAAGNNTATLAVTYAAGTNAAEANAQTAADAAAEATDAANAATDAANAAAEAADAATAAAQDAADAVAALSAQVATLISGLKSQLTALTNLVIKIQKKVKA